MKILVVTGKLAEGMVREAIEASSGKHVVDLVVLPVQVISLLSTEQIAKHLREAGVSRGKYDLIVVPGACRGSARVVEEEVGVPCVKGTLHAFDLPLILQLEDPLEVLSRDEPANGLLERAIVENNLRLLLELEGRAAERSLKVRGLSLPVDPPPFRIISEIPGAHRLSRDELLGRAVELLERGADVVALGFEPFNPSPDRVGEVVRAIREELDVPIAIDTLAPSEIARGVGSGADLVMSVDACNVDFVLEHLREAVPVVVPYDSCRDYLPGHGERVEAIRRVASRVGERVEGFVLDPILDPPIVGSIVESINEYRLLRNIYRDKPLLMGVGNVVELVDVDSVGVNFSLALLALEVGASLLLTVEASSKTLNSTRELAIASEMLSLAYLRKSPPKNLGVDLLVLKDKYRVDFELEASGAEVVDVDKYEHVERGPLEGYFKIRVDHASKRVEVLHAGEGRRLLIRSSDVEHIKNYILDKGLVSSPSHSIYLGMELAKASEALRVGKNYVQGSPLFREKAPLKRAIKRGSGH